MLARRFHAARAVIASVVWCGGLRVVLGPVVALPFGPVVAPVWLFAIFGAAMLCLPIVSASLVTCERQAVRSGRRLRAGRVVTFTLVYGLALGVFAVARLTVALLAVALACAGLCLVLAAVLGDAAVVVVLAAGLVTVFASTYPWFAQPLIAADAGWLLVAAALVAAGAVVSVAGRG